MTNQTSVDLTTKRLDIGDGRWVEVRNELTARERKRASANALQGVRFNDKGDRYFEDVNALADQPFRTLMAWITEWNIAEPDGRPVPCTVDGLASRPDWLFDTIEKAVDTHIEAQRAAAKNGQTANSTTSSAS